MKRPWVLPLLFGIFLGALIGFGSSLVVLAFLSSHRPKGSDFLKNFSFQEAAAKAGDFSWEIISDDTETQLGTREHSSVVTRRIVARAVIPPNEQNQIAGMFESALTATLREYGGNNTGDRHNNRSGSKRKNGKMEPYQQQLQRRYYVLGKVDGAADTWLLADGERATLIILLTEGY